MVAQSRPLLACYVNGAGQLETGHNRAWRRSVHWTDSNTTVCDKKVSAFIVPPMKNLHWNSVLVHDYAKSMSRKPALYVCNVLCKACDISMDQWSSMKFHSGDKVRPLWCTVGTGIIWPLDNDEQKKLCFFYTKQICFIVTYIGAVKCVVLQGQPK